MGIVEGNRPVSDNDWEAVTRRGDAAIKRWIGSQMYGRTCAAILIGTQTSGRKWITYEIQKAWNDGKGLVGIHIHNLLNRNRQTVSAKGANPFYRLSLNGTRLSSIVRGLRPAIPPKARTCTAT